MSGSLMSTDSSTVSILDGVALFWVALWLSIGAFTAVQVWQLSGLTDAADASARAVDTAGEALQGLGDLPAIGGPSEELGDEVRAAATEISERAEDTRTIVARVSVLLGISIVLIPLAPVLVVYLPLRLRRRAYVAGLRRQIRSGNRDPAIDAFLAHRAVSTMTLAQLLKVSSDPVGDLIAGRHDRLADAHLRRLGV